MMLIGLLVVGLDSSSKDSACIVVLDSCDISLTERKSISGLLSLPLNTKYRLLLPVSGVVRLFLIFVNVVKLPVFVTGMLATKVPVGEFSLTSIKALLFVFPLETSTSIAIEDGVEAFENPYP